MTGDPRLITLLVRLVVLEVQETETHLAQELVQPFQAQPFPMVAVAHHGTLRLGQMLPQQPTAASAVTVATKHLQCEVMTVVQEL